MKPSDSFKRGFPLERPHCGIPLGNGNMGVLVWGRDNLLSITVNRADFWDHRQGECVMPGQSYEELCSLYDPYDVGPVNERIVRKKMPLDSDGLSWRPARIPVGRLEFTLASRLSEAVLDYRSGILRISAGNSVLSIFIDLESNSLYIEDPDGNILKVSCRPSWEWVGEHLRRFGFAEPELFDPEEVCGWRQPCPDDPGITVKALKKDYGYCIDLLLDGEKPAERDIDTAKTGSSAWWKEYWLSVPELEIPDDFLNGFWKFALFKFACATHPGGIACGLQGPWIEDYQKAQWSGDYHFNVNIQQIYTFAFAAGRFEHLMPLFDMLESEPFMKVMRDNARNLFGIVDGILMTHAVDDRGMQCGWISAGAILDFACGGWTALLYWLYYKYTLDEDFLRKRAYPFIYGVMRVFEEALREHEGRLSIPLSISAEYGCTFPVKKNGRLVMQNTGRDPSYQLSCAHMLADILLEASDILKTAARPVWKDIKERLPHYTLAGNEGERHIAVWEGQDLDVCHRHHSHLACIYPFDTLPEPSPEERGIIENSVDHWITRGMGSWSEWCYPWAAIIHARIGFRESPALLLGLWREIFINEGWATVYLPRFRGLTAHRRSDMNKPKETNEIMQLDGTMGAAAAIVEMLVHQKGKTVFVFPAVPEKWTEISFRNIRLPGAFLISAEKRNGKVTSIEVKSLKGGNMKICIPGVPEPVEMELKAGETRRL